MSRRAGLEDPAAAPAPSRPAGGGARRRLRWLLDGLRVTLPAWLLARLLVCLVSWHLNPHHPLGKLFAWDTVWYRFIAANGYDAAGELIHFFPLTPLAAMALATATRLPVTIALFAVCWAGALLFGAFVHRLVVRETDDRAAARCAAWLTQLAPGGYALVMGYTEPLAGALAAGYFLAVRGHGGRAPHWWAATAAGLLSGFARPTGLLLAIPGAWEGLRAARARGWRGAVAVRAAMAAGAPVAGLVAFLAYCRLRYRSWTLPFAQQTLKANRGRLVNNPLRSFHTVWRQPWHGHQTASMCVLLIAISALLLPVMARRLPASYTLWTLPMWALAVTSHDFTSLPRYVGALFPLLIAAALGCRRWWSQALLLAASITLLIWTAHVALAGYLVA